MEWFTGLIGWVWSSEDNDETRLRGKTPLRRKLYDQSEGKCFCCGITLQECWHAGHIVARKHGGSETVHNMRAVCPGCNSEMRCENMFEFIVRKNLSHGVKKLQSDLKIYNYIVHLVRLKTRARERLETVIVSDTEKTRLLEALDDPAKAFETIMEIENLHRSAEKTSGTPKRVRR